MKLMNAISLRFFKIIITFSVLSLALLGRASSAESPGIKITEPSDGSTVNPGQEIIVTIEAVGGFELEDGLLGVSNFFQEDVTVLPSTFTVTIPNEVAGKIPIDVFGRDASGKFVGDEITLNVEQTAELVSLSVHDDFWVFVTDWDGNVDPDDAKHISVRGMYSDGVERKMLDEDLTFVSSDPSVVSVDSEGVMKPHKLGEAVITVSSAGVSATVSVTVRKPRGIPPEETISPTTQIDIQPSPNRAGWHNSNVTVTLTATDNEGGSGVKEIKYWLVGMTPGMKLYEEETVLGDRAEAFITREGITRFGYYARDNEHNSEPTHFVDFKLDKTPPLTKATVTPAPNAAGWNNTDVTVTFSAQDQKWLSGIDRVDSPVVITTEGEAQEVTGRAWDKAGNESSVTITVNIDKTPPEVEAGEDIKVAMATSEGTTVAITPTVTDNLDPNPVVETDAPDIFPLGTTEVTVIATDQAANAASDKLKVTVYLKLPEGSVKIVPHTINVRSRRGNVLVFIREVGMGLSVYDIDSSSLVISNPFNDKKISAKWSRVFPPKRWRGSFPRKDPWMLVVFSKKELIDSLEGNRGNITLTISGSISTGTFEGESTVRVIRRRWGWWWRRRGE